MKSGFLDNFMSIIPLNSWFWISFLYFGQGLSAILFARAVKIPAMAVFLPILVLFIGGLASFLFYRLSNPGNDNWLWAVAVFFYALFIFLMSSRSYPGATVPFNTSYFHPLEYLTLGLLLGRFWYSLIDAEGFWSFAIRVIVAGGIFGCSDELHQFFVPGRHCNHWDVFLDLSGIMCSLLIIASIRYVILSHSRVAPGV